MMPRLEIRRRPRPWNRGGRLVQVVDYPPGDRRRVVVRPARPEERRWGGEQMLGDQRYCECRPRQDAWARRDGWQVVLRCSCGLEERYRSWKAAETRLLRHWGVPWKPEEHHVDGACPNVERVAWCPVCAPDNAPKGRR